MTKITLAIHAGASGVTEITRNKESEIKAALSESLNSGYHVLKSGGSALDAVEAAIRVLEDCPWFNAGRGAAITDKGTIELHSCLMDGKTLSVGALASVTGVRNPISLARKIMDHSRTCFLCDEGAEKFAKEHDIQFEDAEYFFTEHQREGWEKKRGEGPSGHGTVGAVALDAEGNLAAGTSTGGLMNAVSRRVSDSAIAGASTYANNRSCAVCCTGDGEVFIKTVMGKTVSDLLLYKGLSLKDAVLAACEEDLQRFKADVGVVALDLHGETVFHFNTGRMYRGKINDEGESVEIY